MNSTPNTSHCLQIKFIHYQKHNYQVIWIIIIEAGTQPVSSTDFKTARDCLPLNYWSLSTGLLHFNNDLAFNTCEPDTCAITVRYFSGGIREWPCLESCGLY